jgi:hypothetical protein
MFEHSEQEGAPNGTATARAARPGWLAIDHSQVRANLGAIYLTIEQKFRFTASSMSAFRGHTERAGEEPKPGKILDH